VRIRHDFKATSVKIKNWNQTLLTRQNETDSRFVTCRQKDMTIKNYVIISPILTPHTTVERIHQIHISSPFEASGIEPCAFRWETVRCHYETVSLLRQYCEHTRSPINSLLFTYVELCKWLLYASNTWYQTQNSYRSFCERRTISVSLESGVLKPPDF
jgi:hypothetical protein